MSGTKLVRIYRDLSLLRAEFTLPKERWAGISISDIPHHKETMSIGLKSLGSVARLGWGTLVHKVLFGSSQTGKTTCLADMIISIARTMDPASNKVLILNPKNDEMLNRFGRLAHLEKAIGTNTDDSVDLLRYALGEMELRRGDPTRRDRWVLFVDEVAEMSMASKAVGPAITRLSQMAGGLGIHLVCASQSPYPKVFGETGSLAGVNFKTHISFYVQKQYEYFATGGITGLGVERLGGDGDGYIISGSKVTRFRAALPHPRDYENLPRVESVPVVPREEEMAGDSVLCWSIEDLADRMGFAQKVSDSGTAIRDQFGGAWNRASFVRDLLRRYGEKCEEWEGYRPSE
jgi:hypothetical protein